MPESLQAVALQEAIDYLRSGEDHGSQDARISKKRKGPPKKRDPAKESDGDSDNEEPRETPDENTFFSQLASESGIDEDRLRDVLHLTKTGIVHVTPPTKDLGASVAQQAKCVIALVASARARGLGEHPVSADAVRSEAKRKHCFLQNNFAGHHLSPMKGFNAGSNRSEIVLTSKWLDDFKSAVATVSGVDLATED
jgi:hypothetical protein